MPFFLVSEGAQSCDQCDVDPDLGSKLLHQLEIHGLDANLLVPEGDDSCEQCHVDSDLGFDALAPACEHELDAILLV